MKHSPAKQADSDLPMTGGRGRSRKGAVVLRITIFKRAESQFYQACVRMPDGTRKRITTRTTLQQAAEQFAELAYRNFARTQNPEPRTQNPEPRTQNPEPRTQNPTQIQLFSE